MSAKPVILIIDDDHDTLDLLEVILFKEYEVVTALNGFEGLQKAREIVPDLILTDIMMPVMDGIMFFNNLRKTEQTAALPAIAITSFTEVHSIKSLLNLGFCDVITKPFVKDEMLKAIRTVIGQKPSASPRSEASTDTSI